MPCRSKICMDTVFRTLVTVRIKGGDVSDEGARREVPDAPSAAETFTCRTSRLSLPFAASESVADQPF